VGTVAAEHVARPSALRIANSFAGGAYELFWSRERASEDGALVVVE